MTDFIFLKQNFFENGLFWEILQTKIHLQAAKTTAKLSLS